ncbi:HAMP domain-containing protein [Psychromonas antarctica]|jgi:methyl-accepting chemotaxis protein|uniref:HAMP domain-containing protein n=1 Tax=Psychromonas antarctica TaxID=67573 RepID=UPI001EE97252|nr:methyl-accepting chemotaxis protein [Psychromonas antarctica]MCG6201850.1 methyl-accepting chemotaxis protein [Psychromonas antarctica]
MLIKHKLITNTVVTIVSMIAMLLLMNFTSSSLRQDTALAQNLGKIEAGILQLRSHEKDFLARKKSVYIDEFNTDSAILQANINQLKDDLKSINVSADQPIKLSNMLNTYQQIFNSVVETQRRIGFDPQSGFYGELKVAALNAKEAIGDSVMFFKMMLEIRSSEKDYMLLHDDQYIEKFNNDFNDLYTSVKKSYLVQSQKDLIINALDTYNVAFLSLVKEQRILGYNENEGFQKALNDSALKAQFAQIELVRKTNEAASHYLSNLMQLTYGLFSLALLVSIFIAWALSRNIMGAITHIKDSIVRISETNDLTIAVSTKSNDELADMAKAFNYMISNFKNLLTSIKKSEDAPDKKTEILAEDSIWADFIYEESLKGNDK